MTLNSLSAYGHDFQIKVLSSLLTHKEFLINIHDIISDEYFDNQAVKWCVGEILNYFDKYHTVPTLEILKIELQKVENEVLQISIKDQLKQAYISSDADLQYVQEEFTNFCKNQQLKKALLTSVDLLKAGDFDGIRNLVDNALKAGNDKNLGHEYVKDIESSKFLTAEKRMQLYQKGFKEFQEETKIDNATNIIENGLGFYAKSGQLKDLKKEDLEKAMVKISQKQNPDGSPVYSQPQITELSIKNNITNPIHKEIIRSGFTNIALTGSETMVSKGYETYRDYINQGGRNFLQTTMNLDKDEIEFYDRYDFLVSTMKYTPTQAAVAIRDLQKNVNTPEFKAKIVGDKKIKAVADDIVSRFGPYNDYENKQFVYNTVSRLANTVYKIQGTEEQAVEYAKQMIL